MTSIWIILSILIISFAGAIGAIYLKKASKDFKLSFNRIIKDKNLMIGIIFYVLPIISFIYLLKFGEVSVLYPAIATVYIWVSLLSIKMLGEKMSLKKWIGILLIILGVVFII